MTTNEQAVKELIQAAMQAKTALHCEDILHAAKRIDSTLDTESLYIQWLKGHNEREYKRRFPNG